MRAARRDRARRHIRRAASAGTARTEAARAPVGLTAQQERLVPKLMELLGAQDWRGVVALSRRRSCSRRA